jgi:cytochrome c biogenesis protein CcmG, thiol:disulfide interchange protein DsbE
MTDTASSTPRRLPRWAALVPVGVLSVIMGFFAVGLTRDPHQLPTMMVDRPMPAFQLQQLSDDTPNFTSDKLKGHVTLVNVFGSWCVSCVAEHPMLMDLSRQNLVTIHGVDWRDTPREGAAWLARYGNPYASVGLDADSRLAIDLGVTGAPETFLVDKAGRVRYKQIGPITEEIWEETLAPLVRSLEEESQ